MNRDENRWAKCLVKVLDGIGNVSASGWQPTDRIIPTQFRRELRGIGAAEFEVVLDEAVDRNEIDYLYSREVIIYDGRGIDSSSITDIEDTVDGRVLWRGFFHKNSLDFYEGKNDHIGRISADEYGQIVFRTPIDYGEELTPDFNPVYENQKGNFQFPLNFRNKDFIDKIDGEWQFEDGDDTSIEDQGKIWTRERILRFLEDKSDLTEGIIFPWEKERDDLVEQNTQAKAEIDDDDDLTSPEKEEKKRLLDNKLKNQLDELITKGYKWFKDYEDIPPISNYEGDSLFTALVELIPDSCDFYFNYNTGSSSKPVVTIINKSAIALPDINPAAQKTNFIVPPRTEVLNFTINVFDIYDKLIVRGENHLWSATVGIWDHLNDGALEPDWTEEEEKQFLTGLAPEDITSQTQLDNETLSNITRRVLNHVFAKFKWRENGITDTRIPLVGSYSGNFPESGGEEKPKNAFFGFYDGIFVRGNSPEEGLAGDKDLIIPSPFISTDLNIHRTPNKMAIEWEDFLPFSTFSKEFNDNFEDAKQQVIVDSRFATPSVISETQRTFDPGYGEYWVPRDIPFGAAEAIQIQFHTDGVILVRDVQSDLHFIDETWQLKDGDTVSKQTPAEEDFSKWRLPTNVNDDSTADSAFLGKTNYWRHLITLSGRSNQKLEAFRLRRDKNGEPVEQNKVKVVNVPGIEMWFAHHNTVRGLTNSKVEGYNVPPQAVKEDEDGEKPDGENKRDKLKNTIIRIDGSKSLSKDNRFGVTVLRDDRKKLIQILNSLSNIYLVPGSEMSLVLPLDTDASLDIGQMIGEVLDGNKRYTVNSAVSSIQYIFEDGPPRVSFHTLKPESSLLTQVIREAEQAKGVTPQSIRDTRNPREIE